MSQDSSVFQTDKNNQGKNNKKKLKIGSKKILLAYFSHSGNTRTIAVLIHNMVGGDIFEIVPVDSYPSDHDKVVEQTLQELSEYHIPKLTSKLGNMESYDLIFIGYPNWWGTIPLPVESFLSEYDLSGKTIIPFCTHEGSGMGRSLSDIKNLLMESFILDGFSVRGSNAKNTKTEISDWLQKIGMIE